MLPDPQDRQGHTPPPHAIGDGEKASGYPQGPGRDEQAGHDGAASADVMAARPARRSR
jgi:hypothetical protein